MAEIIFQFDKKLHNTLLNAKFEAYNDENERITYRLVKGDKELVMNKQKENAVPQDFLVHNTLIPVKDATIQKWLKLRPQFGKLIKIYDPVAENKTKVDEVKNNLKTVMKVMELDNFELLGLGYQLLGQKALDMVKKQKGDHSGLKLELSAMANEKPELIEEKLSNNNATYTWFGIAFAKGIIKEDESGTKITWGDKYNNGEIMTVVPGTKPLDAIVEFSTTTEGSTTKQMIGQRLQDEAVQNKINKVTSESQNKYPESLKEMKELAAEKGYPEADYSEISRKDKMIEYLESKETEEA